MTEKSSGCLIWAIVIAIFAVVALLYVGMGIVAFFVIKWGFTVSGWLGAGLLIIAIAYMLMLLVAVGVGFTGYADAKKR